MSKQSLPIVTTVCVSLLLSACAHFAPPSFQVHHPIQLPPEPQQPSQIAFTVRIPHTDTYSPYLMLQAHNVQERTAMRTQLKAQLENSAKVSIYDAQTQHLIMTSTHAPTLRFYDPVQHDIGLMLTPTYFQLKPGTYTVKISLSGDYRMLPADINPRISLTNWYQAQ